jgi:hypothetical protein
MPVKNRIAPTLRFRYDSFTEMFRIFFLYLIGSISAFGQQGLADDAFDRIPFEQWLKGEGEARIRWSTHIFPDRLGVHQRLRAFLSVGVDGAEFVKRSGVVVFVEIRDRDNRVFRTHRVLKFSDLKNPSDLAAVNFDQSAFVVPGDYQVATAVYDPDSKEHALKRTKLHVPEIPHDPLPGSWRDLPEVEFLSASDPPDTWYVPEVSSRLYLPVQTSRTVRIEVVVNESPTEMETKRVGRVSRRNMANVIPALKVLSQMDIRNGSIHVTLLDLERRKLSFNQELSAEGKLDWTRLRAALVDNDPNKIDVHALENHEQNAQFFVSEIRKRLEGTESNGDVPLGLTVDPARVLIVLSGPMAFPKGQDLRPIEAAPEPGTKVFYICYYPPRPGFGIGPSPELAQPGLSGRHSVSQVRPPAVGPRRGAPIDDSLARTLKPLAPRQFNVTTPMEFRNALAAIISEISQLK